MAYPLRGIQLPPPFVDWSCERWLFLYGPGVTAGGCAAADIIRSPGCDEGCRTGFAHDPSFATGKCPETCGLCGNVDERCTCHDMEHPLAEWLPGHEAMLATCAQWVEHYGRDIAANGCLAKEITASATCDAGCKELFTRSPNAARERCPRTCGSCEPSAVHECFDLAKPLVDFVDRIGAAAGWTCEEWVSFYGPGVKAARCEAQATLASEACDGLCHETFGRDGTFMRRRCPITCGTHCSDTARGVDAHDQAAPLGLEPHKAHTPFCKKGTDAAAAAPSSGKSMSCTRIPPATAGRPCSMDEAGQRGTARVIGAHDVSSRMYEWGVWLIALGVGGVLLLAIGRLVPGPELEGMFKRSLQAARALAGARVDEQRVQLVGRPLGVARRGL